MSSRSLSVAYILQLFPDITQTFIYREVSALREQGIAVHTFSIYKPAPTKISTEAVPFIDETSYVFPLSWRALILAHLRYLFARPLRYLSTLLFVLSRPDEPLHSRWRTLLHFLYGMIMVRQVEALTPKHIHAHFGWSASTIALIAHRLLDVPFSVTFHAFHTKGAHPRRLLARDKIRDARFVVVISEYHRQFLQSLLPHDAVKDKIHVVHHGLDPDIFTPSTGSDRSGGGFNIISVGQLIPCKGFDVLIQACQQLVDRDQNFSCRIFGEGPDRTRLEDLVDLYKLRDRVQLPGRIDQNDLRILLNQADVFALPCLKDDNGRQDGLPVVLTEAMAMEVPVVSTTLAAIPELIHNGRNGLLVPPKDATALADALQRLKADSALRRQLGEAGRETVLREFNIYRSAEQLAELFAAH
jgi:glycosyltransferase involved in cell wall biosynthesis